MFNDKLIGMMKRGSYIVNTARGKICDRDAIVRALESGQLAGYAGDVWFPQPAPRDHPWRTMPHHGMTPHISGTSLSAQTRYAAGTREILSAISEESRSGPNISWWTRASWQASARIHIPRATRPKARRKPRSSRNRYLPKLTSFLPRSAGTKLRPKWVNRSAQEIDMSEATQKREAQGRRQSPMSPRGSKAPFRVRIGHVRFSNRPFGVKHFQTIHHHCSVDVAHGLL